MDREKIESMGLDDLNDLIAKCTQIIKVARERVIDLNGEQSHGIDVDKELDALRKLYKGDLVMEAWMIMTHRPHGNEFPRVKRPNGDAWINNVKGFQTRWVILRNEELWCRSDVTAAMIAKEKRKFIKDPAFRQWVEDEALLIDKRAYGNNRKR